MPVYQQINEKMVSVTLNNESVIAKKGAMLAYQGDVVFSRTFLAGGNVQDLAMRVVTNESYAMMLAEGSGTVFYGEHGLFASIVSLKNEILYVESESVLAFDARLQPDTMFIGNQGVQSMLRGAVSGQGLFTTTLMGSGEVAILSDGNIIALPVSHNDPVCVDPDAYIAHKGDLTSSIVTDLNWKTFIGQASGESYQIKFTGQGVVYIQASER